MGKANDGSECFTRTNNSGGRYTTCEGTQKTAMKAKAKAKAKPKKNRNLQKTNEVRRAEPATLDKFRNFSASLKNQFKFGNHLNSFRKRDFGPFQDDFMKNSTYTPKRIAEYNEALGKAVAGINRFKKQKQKMAGQESQRPLGQELYFEDGTMKYFPNPRKKKT